METIKSALGLSSSHDATEQTKEQSKGAKFLPSSPSAPSLAGPHSPSSPSHHPDNQPQASTEAHQAVDSAHNEQISEFLRGQCHSQAGKDIPKPGEGSD
ncbi:MAG: hypothetical protein M1819_002737 [Sarea resinae]|nr:MAG: hypothetical protein M1819_002737 [Sarea resinae]